MKPVIRITTLMALVVSLIIAFLTSATTASAAQQISVGDARGYVDVSNIHMSGSTFVFTVSIQTTTGAIPVNPLYFVAKASDGTTYDSPDYSYTTLHSSDLPAGERVKGDVAFEITGPRPTSIVYEGVLGGVVTKWNITWRKPKAAPRPPSPFGS